MPTVIINGVSYVPEAPSGFTVWLHVNRSDGDRPAVYAMKQNMTAIPDRVQFCITRMKNGSWAIEADD